MEAVMTCSQAFFGWLLQTTLIASMVVCLILLIQRILGNKLGPRWCHALWLVLLIRMILPWSPSSRVSLSNLIPSWQKQTHIQQSPGSVEVQEVSPSEQAAETPETITSQEAESEIATQEQAAQRPRMVADAKAQSGLQLVLLRRILPILWLAGAIVIGVYLLVSDLVLWRIVKRDSPLVNQPMLELFEECKAEMGVQSLVAVVPSDRVRSPGLFGFVRPRLLLPRKMLDSATTEEMRYVFLHELAHLRRHDIYLGWLTSLLQVLHWFNPLVWFAFYRMRADRELACDALVLTRTGQDKSQEYGGAILGLVRRFSHSQPLPAMAGIIESKSQLKRRIAMITQFDNKLYSWSLSAIAVIVAICCVSLPNAVGSKEPHASGPESEPSISLRRIKTGSMSDFSSAPSLDGRYLCDIQYRPIRLVIRDLLSGTVKPLTEPTEGYFWCQAISPDSQHVAYVHQTWSPSVKELHLINIDGTGRRVLYRFEEDEMFHIRAWTPDGKKVIGAFEKRNAALQLVAFSVEDGSMQVLHTFETYWPMWQSPLHKVAISPNGRYLAYDRPPEKGSWNSDIYVLDIKNKKAECVLQRLAYDKLLDWTPDGNYIFFKSDRRQGIPGGFTATDTWDAYLLPVADGKPEGAPILVKRDIPEKLRPKGFARDGTYFYAVEFRTIEVAVAKLDLKMGKLEGRPQVVGQTGADQIPAWSPDGRYLAYCTHELDNTQTIHIQNIAMGQERKLDPNLPHFTWLRWSPDGKSFLVSNFAKNSPRAVYRIDAETGKRFTMIETDSSGTLPGEPQLSPDGSTLFYVLRHSDSPKEGLLVRNIESGHEKELFALGDTGGVRGLSFELSPDGRQLALATQVKASSGDGVDRRILIMPAKGGEPTELWKPGGLITEQTITWTPDGKALLFTKRVPEGGRELWLVPTAGGPARKICGPRELMCQGMIYGSVHSALDMHPDGQRIAFDCFEYRHEVWVMKNFLPETAVAESEPEPEPVPTMRQIEVRGRGTRHSRPSLDGKYMSDVDRDSGNLVIRNLAEGKQWNLTNKDSNSGDFADSSAISPDSTKVIYYWFNAGKEDFDLRVVGLDGSGDRLLWGAREGARYFNMDAWSPDSKYVYGEFVGEDKLVCLVRVSITDGSREVIKTFDEKRFFTVSSSPDGRYITYDCAKNKSLNRDIYIYDLKENTENPLIRHEANDKLLGWAPDGEHILFTSDRNGTWDGWLLRIVDGKPVGLPEVIKAGIGDVSPIGFTRDGSFYYTFNHQAWNVYTAKLDLDTGEVVSEPKPVRHVGHDGLPDWSPDGRYLAYLSELDRNKPQIIRIRTLTTGRERELKTDLPYFRFLHWCPDSRHLLITDFKDRSVVYRLDVQDGEYTDLVRSIQSEGQKIKQAELSADGKTLAYRIRGRGTVNRLMVKDMQTGHEKELLQTEGRTVLAFAAGWALSPDGKKIAFSIREGTDSPYVLKIISVDTGDIKDTGINDVWQITWTDDGNHFVFTKTKNLKELWTVPIEQGEPKKLLEWNEMLLFPSIHPDGQRIAFFSGGYVSEMWVMENFLPKDMAMGK
jgi:beta-lactamase regulating signal transducer with metallopeptidase domain/Tol biopolymer transport system component